MDRRGANQMNHHRFESKYLLEKEPDYNSGNPNSVREWVIWARDQIHTLQNRYEGAYDIALTKTSEVQKLKQELEKAKEDCASYERVISKRKSLAIYDIGQSVYCGPDHIPAQVLAVGINKGGITYKIGYWLNKQFYTGLVPDSEVITELPLLTSRENANV